MSELRLSGISFDEINAERGLPLGAGGQEQEWAATVAIALERMERCLAADRSVVIDDTFCCRWLRRRFCEAARRAGAEPWVLHLETASEVLRRRYRDLQASGERPVLSPPSSPPTCGPSSLRRKTSRCCAAGHARRPSSGSSGWSRRGAARRPDGARCPKVQPGVTGSYRPTAVTTRC